ncbi:MAG TPA: hypothetical protein VEL79_10205 [Vicinamibacterales bacterium]|nr:hypothetical protein [Vicinamibacterales bacterium]
MPVARLAPAIAWLVQDAQVPRGRVAHAFGITPNYLRVLLHRASMPTETHEPAVANRSRLGIRVTDPFVRPSAQRRPRIDALRAQIDGVCRQYAPTTAFLAGAQALKQLSQFPGFSSSPEWLRVRSELAQRRAWFLVHSGHVDTAVFEAARAVDLGMRALKAAQTSGDARRDRKRIADAALIASHGNLLRQTPNGAVPWLTTVEEASEDAVLGSDYYRQRGVYLFQVNADDAAQKQFAKSAHIMEARGEAASETEIRYTGPRHTYFLQHDWEAAQQLVLDARALTPLHASVATHWAVSAGLVIDSADVRRQALALLHDTPYPAADFGHQRTIRFLLELTPDLGLNESALQRWVRYALYANAYRND